MERASKKVQTQSSVVDNVRKQLATLEDTLLHTKKQYKQHEESIEPLRQKVSAAEVRLERLSVERHSLLVYTMVLYTCSVAFLYQSSICSFSVKKNCYSTGSHAASLLPPLRISLRMSIAGKSGHAQQLPPKSAPSHGGSRPPSNAWSHGPTQVHTPNGISIRFFIFVGLMLVTKRQIHT